VAVSAILTELIWPGSCKLDGHQNAGVVGLEQTEKQHLEEIWIMMDSPRMDG